MDPIAVAAASGLNSRMEALDMLSNNLANATTGGYKLDREFYGIFQDAGGAKGITLPVIQKQWTDFQQGLLQPTGNSLDLALNGKGFFGVNGPSGTLYTRNGGFKLSPGGVVSTMEGYPVRGTGGATIQASSSQGAIDIGQDGIVRQGGQQIGQIEVVDFKDANVLSKQGSSYFRLSDTKIQPTPATGTTVQQGQIEGSNVAAAESSVRLVELMRQYEMLQKAVSVAGDMNKKATDEVARVGV